MKVKYRAYQFKGDPEIVKRELDELISVKGDATPAQIVERARDENTELHKCFTWDDSRAADQWRLHEARMLVCSLVVEDEGSQKDDAYAVRCFYKTDNLGYKPTNVIVNQADEYQKLLNVACKELESFRKKYSTLSELAELFELIEKLTA